nr:alpha/beta hydrolase [Actibacterium ureilyticum]
MALALGAVAGGVHLRANARERAAEQEFPPLGQFVTVDGVRIHAVVTGSGPDLVLIHGASGNLRDFTFDLVPQLARDFRVIAFDRPGLGWSDPAPDGHLLARQADLLHRAAVALGADRPLVLGQSYGGAVALNWALTHPDAVAGLITVSAPSHPWPTGLPTLYRVTSHPLGQALAVPLITALVPDSYLQNAVDGAFDPQDPPQGYASHFGPALSARRQTLRSNADQRAALKDEIRAMSTDYGRITVPVEMLHGTADDVVDFNLHALQLLRDLPDAHLTRLPGIGHMPHHAAQGAVLAAIHRAATRAGLR